MRSFEVVTNEMVGDAGVSPASCVSEPVATIGDPPAGEDNRDGGGQRPPQGKHDIGEQSERGEGDPEDLAFHPIILCRRAAEAAFRK